MKSGIINLRKEIFNNLKHKAFSYEGHVSSELTEYKVNQEMLSKRAFSKSNIDELQKAVAQSSAIYLGDFHTFDQNIRNVLRIVKYLVQNEDKCIIALEMVDAKYQLYIDSYLEGHITDLEFLESIEYHDSWRFPWSHYKLIFELAKANGIKIIGLNTSGSLSQRDLFASKLISSILKKESISKVLVVYGELHISKNKIPSQVAKLCGSKQTIIHQNLDEVYWNQIEDKHSSEIVKFDENEFCINSAPPWIKYESMIYWYENLCDDPDFDIHEYIIENGKKIFSDDTNDNFSVLCNQLIQATNLKIDEDEYNDFNIYDHTRLDFIEDKILELNNIKEIEFYSFLISRGFSFRLPNLSSYYCSSYSVNRLAYLCGIHLFHIYNKDKSNLFSSLFTNKNDSAIIYNIYEHMFAYFFSKVINPHRKCALYKDFIINQNDSKSNKINRNILDHKNLSDILKDNEISDLLVSSIDIGHVLGEYLYTTIATNNDQASDIDKILGQLRFDDFSFQVFKNSILSNFNYKEHLKRYF